MARRQFNLICLLASLTACPARPPPAAEAPDAGPPPLPDRSFAIRISLLDGGIAELPLEPGSRPTVDPGSALTVEMTPPLRNFRVRLFDEADRVVASDDRLEEGDVRTTYQVQLLE